MTSARPATATFAPAPGRAPITTLLLRHSRFELTMAARRSEAIALNLVVPILGMLVASLTDVIRLPADDRPGYVVPGAIALAVMATSFTGAAIALGYERFYGSLKRLGASPLGRTGLLTSKSIATIVLVLAQAILLATIGVAIGWRPHLDHVPASLAVTLLATTAYLGFAFTLASLLRPETTTAAATLLYTVLLIGGGVMFPTAQLDNAQYLIPITAHAEVLRVTLTHGDTAPSWAWYGLALWAVLGIVAAARNFRWE